MVLDRDVSPEIDRHGLRVCTSMKNTDRRRVMATAMINVLTSQILHQMLPKRTRQMFRSAQLVVPRNHSCSGSIECDGCHRYSVSWEKQQSMVGCGQASIPPRASPPKFIPRTSLLFATMPGFLIHGPASRLTWDGRDAAR